GLVASLGVASHGAHSELPAGSSHDGAAGTGLGGIAAAQVFQDATGAGAPAASHGLGLGEAPHASSLVAAPQHHTSTFEDSTGLPVGGLSALGQTSVGQNAGGLTATAGHIGAGYFSHGIDVGGISAIQTAAQGTGGPAIGGSNPLGLSANAGAVAQILSEALQSPGQGHDLASLIQSLPGGGAGASPLTQLAASAPAGGELGGSLLHASFAGWTGSGFDAGHLADMTHHAAIAAAHV
ncbi:MAG TPA: hypothetical protein VF459_15920, partial [Caulobacteraceae bacterium]